MLKIKNCRVCGNHNLIKVLDLGDQQLTGTFPRSANIVVESGPLELVKCHGGDKVCGLLQLAHTYSLSDLYGENYGYRSGLNPFMVQHLQKKVADICSRVNLNALDLCVDIGSNDGTSLNSYPAGLMLVGVDPTAMKFKDFYKTEIKIIPDFFSPDLIKKNYGEKKAKVVTSFSMFYDLENPVNFAKGIAEILDENGIWVFEQSYMPTMIDRNSYDTVCHEHLEYYGLHQIKWILDTVGLKIIDVEFNDINGGSFSVTAALSSAVISENIERVNEILESEVSRGFNELSVYQEFEKKVQRTRLDLIAFLDGAKYNKKTVYGLGASTKGNVILQFCNITAEKILEIAEINPDKFGAFTPGTKIPIKNEDEILAKNPDYLVVLPWHFRDFIVNNPRYKNSNLVFPLPFIEVVHT